MFNHLALFIIFICMQYYDSFCKFLIVELKYQYLMTEH